MTRKEEISRLRNQRHMTFQKIAIIFGISRQRVQQIYSGYKIRSNPIEIQLPDLDVSKNKSIINYITASNITCSFSSSLTIYETQYKCTLRENEFNFSQNPSLSSGSTFISSSAGIFFTPGQYLANNVTGSYFSPYVTTVGLYDEYQNLLAVGKLAQPLPVSPTTDTTILINLDR